MIVSSYTWKEVFKNRKDFLNQSIGPLELSLGDFDGDNIEDIFIFNNGQNPEGYFVYLNGSEKKADLKNCPRLSLLYNKGVDLNFDGIDDMLMIDLQGRLHLLIVEAGGGINKIMDNKLIPLLENNIQEIIVHPNKKNGLIDIIAIGKLGQIGKYTIDLAMREISFIDNDSPNFIEPNFTQVFHLISEDQIIMIMVDYGQLG